MKKMKFDEEIDESFDFYFENNFANRQISVSQNESALENIANFQTEVLLDGLLSAIKFIFLFIPGAMLLHLVGMFLKVFFLYGEKLPKLLPQLAVATFIGTLLTMFGIGKLSDLRYLKVPAAILAMSLLLSVMQAIMTVVFEVDSQGWFMLFSTSLVIVWGYLVKRFLDKQ